MRESTKPSLADRRKAEAKIEKHFSAPVLTLDSYLSDGSPLPDDAHKTVTAKRCNGHAGPYCTLLSEFLDPEVNAQKKGLVAVVSVHRVWLPNGWHCGVGYRQKKMGTVTMLEFCPWCGANIRAVFPKAPGTGETAKKEAPRG